MGIKGENPPFYGMGIIRGIFIFPLIFLIARNAMFDAAFRPSN